MLQRLRRRLLRCSVLTAPTTDRPPRPRSTFCWHSMIIVSVSKLQLKLSRKCWEAKTLMPWSEVAGKFKVLGGYFLAGSKKQQQKTHEKCFYYDILSYPSQVEPKTRRCKPVYSLLHQERGVALLGCAFSPHSVIISPPGPLSLLDTCHLTTSFFWIQRDILNFTHHPPSPNSLGMSFKFSWQFLLCPESCFYF